mgnify:CR=1 FL=1
MYFRKMLDFSAILSMYLYTFAPVVFGLNYTLHVVFYVGFRNIVKTNTENQSVKNQKTYPLLTAFHL